MEENLIIAGLDKEEFEALVINIFYYLDYSIDKVENTKFDYYLENEGIKIILKICYKNNNELTTINEVFDFKKEVINTKSCKGYFITNTNFETSVYDQLDAFKDHVRLFNDSESLRLGLRSI